MPNQIQMSPTLTEIWQQSMERISNKSHYHIMKCTSLLTSQHDCLDLCNQMVMREEGVSRVAKTNSNVPPIDGSKIEKGESIVTPLELDENSRNTRRGLSYRVDQKPALHNLSRNRVRRRRVARMWLPISR